ncbi:hypothetical protein BG011_004437 [Mortierella polycephala]|uniref:FAD-binding domain-containing protein n=1 Tax=Mortierella polycephala TaxID=41804 RepID=A0A9P6Q1M0_9FUNG|nr:hypothetical protein BG011_004437 [Mortierella polycephala]
MSTTPTPTETHNPLQVLIVGGGVAGLMMALLLERINVPYTIFERAIKVRPLGSVLSLNANILPVFEQLDLLEDLKKFSLPCTSMDLFEPSRKMIASMAMHNYEETTGYPALVFARPDLYDLMLSRVPKEKILMNKKLLSIEQNALGSLYKKMSEKNLLPKSDSTDMELGYIAMVGVTEPQDPEKIPELLEPQTNFRLVLGSNGMGWHAITIPGNRICWRLGRQISDLKEAKELMFRNSEWGPESIELMLNEYRECPNPFGGTMGDLIDATNRNNISKVYLEEKLFETWYYGRTVLIGDACHKMLPAAGQGAINAMQDAVILANCIYDMGEPTVENIKDAFKVFKDHRYQEAKEQFENSKLVAKLMGGQNWSEKILRKIVFGLLPDWVQTKRFIKVASYRPQAVFLPLAENRGIGPVRPQLPTRRGGPRKVSGNNGSSSSSIEALTSQSKAESDEKEKEEKDTALDWLTRMQPQELITVNHGSLDEGIKCLKMLLLQALAIGK